MKVASRVSANLEDQVPSTTGARSSDSDRIAMVALASSYKYIRHLITILLCGWHLV